jgi:hypothetical protein
MERETPVALFDLDGSLADFEGALRRDLIALQAPSEPPIPDNLWSAEKHEFIRHRMRLIKNQSGWWRNLDRIEKGFEVLVMAKEIGFDTQILTKGPGSHAMAWQEKVEWCRAQPELSGLPVHIVADKGLVYGNVLYDDFPDYLSRWLQHRPRGLGIMPVRASNEGFAHPNVVHWKGETEQDRQQMYDLLSRVYQRQPSEPLQI